MTEDDKGAIGDLLTVKEYYIKRLDMVSQIPYEIDKFLLNITSITIAIFGGIGIALVYLHTNFVSELIELLASLAITIIGIYASLIILSLVNQSRLNSIISQKELNMILGKLNKSQSDSLNNDIITERSAIYDKYIDKLNPKLTAARLLASVICFIRWLMIGYTAYILFALFLLIYCPELFKIVW
jgi:hypothetical protein